MSVLTLSRLTNRKLLRIKGPDCYPYLQGLLCNDLRYLYEPDRIPRRKHARISPNVMSTFMLNAQGRAICDLLIYRTPATRFECEFTPPGKSKENDELFIECDAKLASGLANTLYGYRVRRKIEMTTENEYSIWSLYPKLQQSMSAQEHLAIGSSQMTLPVIIDVVQEIISNGMIMVNDPRLMSLGMRIITKERNFDTMKSALQNMVNVNIEEGSLKQYLYHRLTLGVGEGVDDHPESNCLPLECNADYLGTVSFTKGCYLGQELTSRIHHTGVVRKRLMPIVLDLKSIDQTSVNAPLVNGSEIIDGDSGKRVGQLRHVVRNRALALMRFEGIDDKSKLIHDGTKALISTYKPYWWRLQNQQI